MRAGSFRCSQITGSEFLRPVKDLVIRDAYKLVCIVADTDDGNRLVDLYEKHYGFRKYPYDK